MTAHISAARRLLAAAVLLGVLGALVPATPASAHGSEAPTASDFRSRLVAVTPRVAGLELRLVSHGTHLYLRNGTGRDVEVRGYAGEPYLKFTADAVYANTRSFTAYTNKTLDPKTAPPDKQPPEPASWRRLASEPALSWHDHRTHWMPSALPPAAAASPGKAHRISDWTVDLIADGKPVRVLGILDYLPPPAAPQWWIAVVLAAAAAALLGRLRRGLPLLGGLLAIAATASLVDGVGRLMDAGSVGWQVPGALFVTDTYATLTALGALAAAYAAVRARSAAPFALVLAAACLALLGGATHLDVFARGGAPVPWSGDISRACIVATLGLSAGVAVAAWLRLRAERPAARTLGGDATSASVSGGDAPGRHAGASVGSHDRADSSLPR